MGVPVAAPAAWRSRWDHRLSRIAPGAFTIHSMIAAKPIETAGAEQANGRPDDAIPPYLDAVLAPLPGRQATVVARINDGLRVLNRWFMVPCLRAGLGAWIGTPFGGYILLLRVRGRRSGLLRETPLSYVITEGAVWVLAGFGGRTQWYRNLLADPEVSVILPGRVLACRAEVAVDETTRARILPLMVRATGVPGLMVGCNPWTAPDRRIVELLEGVPLVRLMPLAGSVAPGPDDPGGDAWVWRQAAVALATLALLRSARSRSRR